MKVLLVFILCLSILTNTFARCADVACDATITHVDTVSKKAHKQDFPTKNNNTDNCSIFCICNCCGAVSNTLITLTYNNIPSYTTNKQPQIYLDKTYTNPVYGIWQPPKL